MTDPRHHPAPPGRRAPARPLAAVALLTALSFGCTTIRQPVSLIQGPVEVRDGVADPQLELWLESARPVTPEESATATAAAREALAEALRGRRIADGSMLLVVRGQGVSRTVSHRRDQTAATVGMVLGAVVVVVAAVLVMASSKGGSGGRGAARASGPAWRGARAGATPPVVSPALPVAAAAGRGAPVRPPPVRPPPVRPPPLRPGPAVHDHAPSVAVGVYVAPGPITWEPGPTMPAPGPSPEVWPAVPVGPEVPAGQAGPAAAPAEAADAAPPAGLAEVVLPALPPFPVEERGFFSDDELVLEFTLVDEATGEPRWMKRVSAKADPCDREQVRRVVEQALDEAAGWIEIG